MLNAKRIIYLNAGHDAFVDPGAVTAYGKESDFNMKIRDEVSPLLRANGFIVKEVPDDLQLLDSIDWVNSLAPKLDDGLALSIHCNCCQGRGAEAFYYGSSASSKAIAQPLIDEYCKETGFENRGAKSDTLSRVGALAWIRRTICWATLIECGFVNSAEDIKMLKDYKRVARGIVRGVCKIYGVPYIEAELPEADREVIKKEIIKLVGKL